MITAYDLSLEKEWRERARAALGVGPRDFMFAFIPFGVTGNFDAANAAAGGGLSLDDRSSGMTSGGGAGGLVVQELNSVQLGTWQGGIFGKVWVAARFTHNSAAPIGAGVKSGISFRSAFGVGLATQLMIGAHGAANVNNYSVAGGAGVNMDSGVAIDSFIEHEHEVMCDPIATITRYWIDKDLKITGNARPAAACSAGRMTSNTVAVLSATSWRWMAIAAPFA